MIEQALDTVLEFVMIHLFPPKTAGDWAFAIFMTGLIWYLAFGALVGWGDGLTQVGLLMMFGVVVISTIVLLVRALQRNRRENREPSDQ